MGDPIDRIDIPGVPDPCERSRGPTGGNAWLGITFRCCEVYGRIYKNKAGTRYTGRCPRCGTSVNASVGEGGTSRRFFETT